MVRPCVARGFRRAVGCAVLHQCIRPQFGACAPGHHGYQRACILITGPASSGPFGVPVFASAGKTVLHLVSSSRRPRLETVDKVTSSLAPHVAQFLCSSQGPFLRPGLQTSIASRAGAVKAGRHAWLAAGSGVARLRLDRAEHGARIKQVGRLHRQSSSARRRVP